MDDRSYEVVKSRDGKNILHITDKDRSVYLGSKYNASRDIQFFLNSLEDIGGMDIIIVFGLGCGEHLYELKDKLGDNSKVLVFEPDKNIINLFNNLEIAKSILYDDRFIISYFNQEHSIETILSSNISDYELSCIIFSHYANYDQVYSDKFLDFINRFKTLLRKLHVNKNTHLAFSKIWFDAFLKNIRIMSKGIPLDEFKDKYQNKPAIIVSAGPSLKKNIHLLKEAQDRFIIITGGRTLKALIDAGVTPHFVCIIDPVDKTFRLVEKSLDCSAPLVFYEGTNPDVAEKYKGPKIYFTANYFAGDFIQTTKVRLNLGGSVAHTCFGLAMHLGCDRVIFVGQDFAFTGDKMHAENAVVKNEENEVYDNEGYIYVDDIYGNKVKTSITFDLFRKTMEDLIRAYPDRTFINSTEGGANIRGTTVMPLKKGLGKYPSNEIINNNDYQLVYNDNYDEVMEKTKIVFEKLKKIKYDCKEGIKLSDKLSDVFHDGSGKDIKKINRKLDKIDQKIKEGFKEAGFVNFILYPVTQMILGFKEFKINKNDPETIKGKKVILKTKKLYEEMSKTLDEAITIIEKYLSYS